jgi:hypothetical protein
VTYLETGAANEEGATEEASIPPSLILDAIARKMCQLKSPVIEIDTGRWRCRSRLITPMYTN